MLALESPPCSCPGPRSSTCSRWSAYRRHGGSVLSVSHELDEVREITDRVTVLRDGRVAGTRSRP